MNLESINKNTLNDVLSNNGDSNKNTKHELNITRSSLSRPLHRIPAIALKDNDLVIEKDITEKSENLSSIASDINELLVDSDEKLNLDLKDLKNNGTNNSTSLSESDDKLSKISSTSTLSSSTSSVALDSTYSNDKRIPTEDDIIIDNKLNFLENTSSNQKLSESINLLPKIKETAVTNTFDDKLKNQLENMLELGYDVSSQLSLDSSTNSLSLSNPIINNDDNLEKTDTPKAPIRKSLLGNLPDLSHSLRSHNFEEHEKEQKKIPKVVEFKDPLHLSISRKFYYFEK